MTEPEAPGALSPSEIGHSVLLASIVLFALVLRLTGLGAWSFWIDEMFTLRNANEILQQGFPAALLKMSPSTILIAATMSRFGVSEWSARLVPALIGSISIPLLYLPVRKLYGPVIGLTSAGLLAIAPWHIYFSQNARYYTALMLFYMLAFFLFGCGLEQKRFWLYLLPALVCLGLAFQERLFALFFIPVALSYVILLYILPFGKPPGLRVQHLLLPAILLLLLVGMYLGLNLLATPDTSQSILGALQSKFVGQPDWQPRWLLTGAIHHVTVPVVCLAIYGSICQIRRRDRIGLFLSLGATVPLICLMILAPFVRTTTHYALMILPCWIILAAIGVWNLFERARTGTIAPLITCAILILLVSLQDYTLTDVRHYMPHFYYGLIVLMLALLVLMPFLLLNWRWLGRNHWYIPGIPPEWSRSLLLWGIGIVLPLMLAALVNNTLYYVYRHGDRANWKSIAMLFHDQYSPGDVIFSTLPPLATYYLGNAAQPLGNLQDEYHIDLDTVLQANRQTWFVEEAGITMLLGDSFASWATTHCTLIAVRDHFISGRNWPLRLYSCDSIDN